MSLLYSSPVLMAVYIKGYWQPLASGTIDDNGNSPNVLHTGISWTNLALSPVSSSSPKVSANDKFTLRFFEGAPVGANSDGILGSSSNPVTWTIGTGAVPTVASSLAGIKTSTTLLAGENQAMGFVPGPSGSYILSLVPASQAAKVTFFKDPYAPVQTPGHKASSKSDSRIMWMAIFGLAAGGATWVCLRGKTYQAQASVVAGGAAAGAAWFAF